MQAVGGYVQKAMAGMQMLAAIGSKVASAGWESVQLVELWTARVSIWVGSDNHLDLVGVDLGRHCE